MYDRPLLPGSIEEIGDQIHFGVRVVNSGSGIGNPISAGQNCKGPNPVVIPKSIAGVGYSVPDFIFGQTPLVPPGGGAGTRRTELIAEVKRDAGTMYRQYISPAQKKKQLNAIIAYSRKHTDTHVAMFIIAHNDLKKGLLNQGRFYIMKRIIGAKALSRNVIPVVVNAF